MLKTTAGDNRTVLIVCLIAFPFSFLIASLVHWFMPVPEPVCSYSPVSAPQGIQRQPAMPPQKMKQEQSTADTVDTEKIKLLEQLYNYRKAEFESGTIHLSDLLETEKRLVVAKAAIYRNGRRGFFPADIYINYVFAKKIADACQQTFKTGKIPIPDVLEAKIKLLELEKQLKMPFLQEEAFLAAAKAWEQTPNDETLKTMIEAEPVRGRRPF